MTTFLIIVLGIVTYLYWQGKREDQKYVENQGGMLEKYKTLVSRLLDGPNPKVEKVHNNTVVISQNTDVQKNRFKLFHLSSKLTIEWTNVNPLHGEQIRRWEFLENVNQDEMADEIFSEMNKFLGISGLMVEVNQFDNNHEPDVVEDLLEIAKSAGSRLKQSYKPVDNNGEFEMIIFYLCVSWIYVLEDGLLKIDVERKIESLFPGKLYQLSKELNLPLLKEQLPPLINNRYRKAEECIIGFKNSDYPNTKQYLPDFHFLIFYYQPLRILPSPSIFDPESDQYESDIDEDLIEFTLKFMDTLNWMTDELRQKI